ncbi:MAG: hypothetical protein ACKVQK_03815, partial [Burkholderiales bacterium]
MRSISNLLQVMPYSRSILALLVFLTCGNGVAQAQSAAQVLAGFPSRPVKLIVPYPPGGAGDLIARSLGAGLQNIWGKAVVVETQAGASGIIAVETTLRAPAD